jgi:hypothetical protein
LIVNTTLQPWHSWQVYSIALPPREAAIFPRPRHRAQGFSSTDSFFAFAEVSA